MTEIKIQYTPRPWAMKFHDSDKKLIVLVLHRRAGKTVASLNHLIRECFRMSPEEVKRGKPDKDKRYAYIAPTYKQAKSVAWDILQQYGRQVPHTKFNIQELSATFPNGSRITLYGADNPDSLRGIGLWGCVFDEYSQQPSNIYSEIILPTLAEHDGFGIWIGTPKGKNDFYRIFTQCGVADEKWEKMSDEDKERVAKDWLSMKLGVKDTKLISDSYLDRARNKMTSDEYEQEFECSFEGSLKGAYYADDIRRAREEKRIRPVPHEPILGVTTAWDLGGAGGGDSNSIGFFQMVGKEIRMIDYYEDTGHSLHHYIKYVKEKPYIYDRHIGPHDIAVTEYSTGRTRIEVAESLGFNFDVAEKLSISDGINAVHAIFPKLYIDSDKCDEFVSKISQYTKDWDEKMGTFKKTPKHDFASHSADMLRTFATSIDIEPDEEDFNEDNTDY